MAQIFSTADIISDSVNQNMDALLRAWDREIEEAFKALDKRAKELDERRTQDADKARRKAYEEANAAAETASLFHYVTGALNAAEANDHIAITIPSGIQVASVHLAGPSIDALLGLISDLSDELATLDKDQSGPHQSILWALAHGYAPHGQDLATIINEHDKDHPWAQRFSQLAKEQTSLPKSQTANAKLRGYVAHQEVSLLKEHVNALRAFGGNNLGMLIGNRNSDSVRLALKTPVPTRGLPSRSSKMEPAQFNQMLNKLFPTKK